jgi:hypothetical protein
MTVLELINELMLQDCNSEVYVKDNWKVSPLCSVSYAHYDDNAPVTDEEIENDFEVGWIPQSTVEEVCKRPMVVVLDGDE